MKKLLFVVVLLIVLIQHLGLVYAADTLQVQKTVENNDIKVGDDVKILLKFKNPFGQELPIKIVDKNIFGNNGIDIQCLEQTLPSENEATITYQPIKPFKPGKYTLNSAEITYTNPETGKEETVKSNTLEIEVKPSNTQQGQAQGITTIYRCNGVNMQSTSYSSSGGSFNIQIGGSSLQQQFNPNPQQGSPQSRLQNNQMNQNTNTLKQQMEQQLQKQKQIEQEFQQNLAKNPEFQKQHENLLNQGYNLTNASFNVLTNNTGSFELSYQKPTGETASLKGEMENGTIKNLMVLTAEERQKILDLLKQNKEFQEYDKKLVNQGFNQTNPLFGQLSQNHTKITVPYKNIVGEEKKITADYINGTIRNVSLEENQNENESNLWWLLLPIILIICIFGWIVYRRFQKKPKNPQPEPQIKIERPVDYSKEAKKMLEEAKRLFINKREKDAYEKVSQAIRFYFSHKLGIKKEIINTELLSILRKEKTKEYPEIQRCLNLCSLVEFAKYRANKKDFDEIISIARKIIV
jgi:HEPN domain-containing protein